IVARILRDEEGLHGQVELVDEHGAQIGLRELTAKADQCDELVRAMALSISIAIDPKSAESYAQGPPDEQETQLNEASPEPDQERPSAARAEEKPREAPRAVLAAPRVLLSVGIGVMGVLYDAPQPTLAGFGFARLRRSAWSLALEARADLPVIDDRNGVRFRTLSYSLRAVPCLHLGVVFVCEVTSVGLISAEGTEAGGKSGTSSVLSLGARAGAEFMLSRSVGLIGQAELLVSPRTVRLASEGTPLWHTERFNGGVGLALALHFP
ncbi:MAG: hypothetical protein ABIQ16_19060, partial [Polyangiaceae bacterium]